MKTLSALTREQELVLIPRLNGHQEIINWCKGKDWKELYQTCDNGKWLYYFYQFNNVDKKLDLMINYEILKSVKEYMLFPEMIRAFELIENIVKDIDKINYDANLRAHYFNNTFFDEEYIINSNGEYDLEYKRIYSSINGLYNWLDVTYGIAWNDGIDVSDVINEHNLFCQYEEYTTDEIVKFGNGKYDILKVRELVRKLSSILSDPFSCILSDINDEFNIEFNIDTLSILKNIVSIDKWILNPVYWEQHLRIEANAASITKPKKVRKKVV
jgi:hypothetical protein